MAAPTNVTVSASQGTGGIVKQSVIELTVSFDSPGTNCDVTAEVTIDGSNWYPATLHSSYNGLNLAEGGGRDVLILVRDTWDSNSLSDYDGPDAKVRITVTTTSTSESTSNVESATFNLKTHKPVISSVTMPQYIGNADATSATVTMTATRDGTSGEPNKYRSDTILANLSVGGSAAFQNYQAGGSLTHNFPIGEGQGFKSVYFKAYDEFYNESNLATAASDHDPGELPWLDRDNPVDPQVTLIGSTGSTGYTGIAIQNDKSFVPDREVTVYVSAAAPVPMTFEILSSTDVEPGANVGTPIDYEDEANRTQTVSVTTDKANPSSDDFNTDATVNVGVRISRAGGNNVVVSKSIRLNTRIYKTLHKPLRSTDAQYAPIVKEVTTGGAEVVIPEKTLLADDPIRKWKDIFFPESHSYPTLPNGNIDISEALSLNGTSSAAYDAVNVDNGELVLDEEGRPITVDWTNDGSKDYGSMISSSINNIQYWVVDNTGYGDFQLEFEHFDLNNTIFGPPYNNLAPHSGDVLTVYDASATGVLNSTPDPSTGNFVHTLADSSLLVELFSFTGSGANVIDLKTGQRMNSSQTGGFKTDWVRGTSLLVIILHTDASGSASGFKLKSGQQHDNNWVNYHIDETNGEVWIHKHISLGTVAGEAATTNKRIIYDYMDRSVEIDHEAGEIVFTEDPQGVVTADYTYYTGDDPGTTLRLASQDDMIDYQDVPTYVVPAGENNITDLQKLDLYESDGHGRITSAISWDKDRGVLDLGSVNVANDRRIVADYHHHTYTRLSNDGYGDLTWRDSVLVADDTPAFPDFTFADVKISNEGDAMLEDGKIIFVPRGYDTDGDGEVTLEGTGIVDQVLDIQRPWDIQKGTAAETHEKMAMQVQNNFLWDRSMPKNDAQTVLSQWRDKSFGDLPSRGRLYGRAVYVLGGTSGSNYPPTSVGDKVCSVEVEGKFYSTLTA